ncbi:hypothetical protein CWC12_10215 [Pseudoalteromonas ruthenica]|nr:hypothetical protein CWC12_10215 [Pseudoalteromonas ruthenica]TMP22303.1 hypothetical protein CWC06_15795 [Pseudoalteromonas ruthenica]
MHESEEDHNSDGHPQWHGMISNSIEISDGHHLARGHYREDGTWVIYGAEHDFQLVEPSEVKYWKPLPKLPNNYK